MRLPIAIEAAMRLLFTMVFAAFLALAAWPATQFMRIGSVTNGGFGPIVTSPHNPNTVRLPTIRQTDMRADLQAAANAIGQAVSQRAMRR
jgi:hypothetical protein